jgi:ribosome-associated protein
MAEEPDISPGGLELAPGLHVPGDLVRFSYTTSRGPGGQNVNKLSTRAVLEVSLGDLSRFISAPVLERLRTIAATYLTTDDRLLISSDEHRSQRANRDETLDKLRKLLLQAKQRPKVRRKTKPTRSSIQRRIDEKKHHGEKKRNRQQF